MQCACVILLSVACLILQNFSTLSHKWHNYFKKVTEHQMCVWICSTNFDGNICHSVKKSLRSCHNCTMSCKVPVIFVRFLKNTRISNFMKIRSVVAEFHADVQADMTKLVVASRSFVNATKCALVNCRGMSLNPHITLVLTWYQIDQHVST